METFFCDGDYELYRALMAEWCAQWQVDLLKLVTAPMPHSI